MPTASHARLSTSPLWTHQRAYFTARGPAAWASGAVPHYVTNTPVLARAYAELLAAFAVDASADPAIAGDGDDERPLYIVELGAGTGRIGFRIARALAAICDARRRGFRPVYVLTDFVEATVAWWQAHPWLAPLFAAGAMDVARFDLTTDRTLHLRVSGRTLSAAAPVDAMAVVANYLFDSLPVDVFAAADGALTECVATTRVASDGEGGGLVACELELRSQPCVPAGYYGTSAIDRALADYRSATGCFTFPGPALLGLERLRAMCRGPWLLIAADKGAVLRADAVRPTAPTVALHGSASLDVNFDAIGTWAVAHGGRWLHTEHRGRALEICAYLLDAPAADATLRAYELAVAQRCPDDFHALKRPMIAHAAELTLAEVLAYLRLSAYDARVFYDCAPALAPILAAASPRERDEVARAITRIWDGYLPIGEADDVALALAEAAAAIERPALAIPLYEASIDLLGPRPAVCARLADALEHHGQATAAARWRARARAGAQASLAPADPFAPHLW